MRKKERKNRIQETDMHNLYDYTSFSPLELKEECNIGLAQQTLSEEYIGDGTSSVGGDGLEG